MRCQPMYMQIAEAVKKQLGAGKLVPGELLPGEFLLAEQFGVSRRTIRMALDVLLEQGFVCRKKGVGTTIAPAENHNRRLRSDIAIICPADEDNPQRNYNQFFSPNAMMRGMVLELAERGHWLRYIPWSRKNPFYEVDTVISSGIDGYAFPMPALVSDILAKVAAARTPHIAYEAPIPVPGLNVLVADEYQAAFDAVRLLRERGYTRIAFLCSFLKPVERQTANRRRLEGFLAGCREFGVELPPDYVRFIPDDREEEFPDSLEFLRQAADSLLRDPARRPEVIVASYLHAAGELLDVLDHYHLSYPGDIGIITFSGSSNMHDLHRRDQVCALSMFEYDELEMGRRGIGILQQWLLDPTFRPGRHVMPFRFKEGNSLRK